MARFPLYIDMKGREAFIVGGGKVALRKAAILAEFGADIRVISPAVCDGLKHMEEQGMLRIEWRRMDQELFCLLGSAFLVICATDDRRLNHEIACYCREHRIWADCADSEEDSTFLFPSVVRRDEIVIGISSSGGVPALTRHLRQKIEQVIPAWYGELGQSLKMQREVLKRMNLSHEEKRQRLRHMIEDAERRRSE